LKRINPFGSVFQPPEPFDNVSRQLTAKPACGFFFESPRELQYFFCFRSWLHGFRDPLAPNLLRSPPIFFLLSAASLLLPLSFAKLSVSPGLPSHFYETKYA
jgi:hypothetical protein